MTIPIDSADSAALARAPGEFASTHWSLVLRAGQRIDKQADDALATLCQRYWLPLYAYARRRVSDVDQAQDLTQSFFARLLEKNVLASATPDRGRFRSFLLTALKNFLSNERDRAHTLKRGGNCHRLSLDWEEGESRLSLEPAHNLTPERLFDRQWTFTLLEHVLTRLRAEFESKGKGLHFELLKGAITGEQSIASYADISQQLGLSEAAARQTARRLKRRYRDLLREEVAQTVASPDELDDEIRQLFGILRD